MSQAMHVYRNTRNGRLGEMTEEQAAIWPDLLVRVEPVAESEFEFEDEGKFLADEQEPVGPKAVPSARSNQKD